MTDLTSSILIKYLVDFESFAIKNNSAMNILCKYVRQILGEGGVSRYTRLYLKDAAKVPSVLSMHWPSRKLQHVRLFPIPLPTKYSKISG